MKIDYDQGIYILEMQLSEVVKIQVGKLGEYEFIPGYYYYCGTAQKNLKARLERHIRKEKKERWHIDYLLEYADILQIYTWPAERELECMLAEKLQMFPAGQIPVQNFGASDSSCDSHLYYFGFRPNLANLVHMIKEKSGLQGDTVL